MTEAAAGPEETDYQKRLKRITGSAPWMKMRDRKQFHVKVFQSGNSVAVRLPAELGFKPGVEMTLDVEDGVFLSLEPVVPEKRKFNIAKVAGSATDLRPIAAEDRVFEERPLDWPALDDGRGEGGEA